VDAACAELAAAKLPTRLMVDCSHANSSKQHERQLVVAEEIGRQWRAGRHQVFGVMVESHLNGGAQKFSPGKDDPANLVYGQSITDACLDWQQTLDLLAGLDASVRAG
jgi:3-deoxy-7-phosphoheptulonate synthase